jgi:hypothetical protein
MSHAEVMYARLYTCLQLSFVIIIIIFTIYRTLFESQPSLEESARSRLVFASLDLATIIILQGPPLWSSGHSSWLQIQRSGYDSRRYHIFWQIIGLERGPLRHVSTIEDLHGVKSSGSDPECREYGHRDTSCSPRGTLYSQKFALNSPTSGGRSVGIVFSWT